MFKYFILLLFICLIACKQPAKVPDPYAGFTERDKIIDAVISQDSDVYNIRENLIKVYVSNAQDKMLRVGPTIELQHLMEDHYFNVADSVFLLMQNKQSAKVSISPALKRKLHIGEKLSLSPVKPDADEMLSYCVLSVPITSKDGNMAFVIATHYCNHCMYTDDYFLKRSNNKWQLAAKKYYRETDR